MGQKSQVVTANLADYVYIALAVNLFRAGRLTAN
jgi:hypothetical protein